MNAKAQKFKDYDESKPHEWPDVDESDLRGAVRALVATHGRVATERRYYDDRAILRVRSVKLTPDGEPAVVRCWQRHGDYDCWAEREWVAFQDDVEPLEDAHGAVEEARCWLHELALALCGCPTMHEALRPSPWGAVSGEPESANPFARSPDAARMELPVTWRTSCPACRANTRETDETPGLVCPECGHVRVCWRPGIDREPLVEWSPRPADKAWRNPTDEVQQGDVPIPGAAAPAQPAATVAAGPSMQAAGARPAAHEAVGGTRPGEESRPTSGLGPVAEDSGCKSRSPGPPPPAPTQRAEGPQEAPSPLASGAPPLAPMRFEDRCADPAPEPHAHPLNYCRRVKGHATGPGEDHTDGDRLFWPSVPTNQGEALAPTGAEAEEGRIPRPPGPIRLHPIYGGEAPTTPGGETQSAPGVALSVEPSGSGVRLQFGRGDTVERCDACKKPMARVRVGRVDAWQCLNAKCPEGAEPTPPLAKALETLLAPPSGLRVNAGMEPPGRVLAAIDSLSPDPLAAPGVPDEAVACPVCGEPMGAGHVHASRDEVPLLQPSPAAVALVGEAAERVATTLGMHADDRRAAYEAEAAERVAARPSGLRSGGRRHSWDKQAGKCSTCGCAWGKRSGVACVGGGV